MSKATLKDKLKKTAIERMDSAVLEATKAVERIAKGYGIPIMDLARLVLGGRTGQLEKRTISSLIAMQEDELVKLYNRQQNLDMDDKK